MEDTSKLEQPRPKLGILIGSSRPNRVGLPVGQWVRERAVAHGAFEVELLDLGEIKLPLLDEPNHPYRREYKQQHTKDWSARVAPIDAFVFVTPEYNYSMSAAMKNALDFLHHEWNYKAVGFVSYGGVAAGTRAVQQLKQVVTTLRMMPVHEAVAIPFVSQHIDEDHLFKPTERMEDALGAMLDELAKVDKALRLLRQEK